MTTGSVALAAKDLFFLAVWAKTPQVRADLIEQGFQEAAAKAKTTAPKDVSAYIDSTLYPPSP